MLHARTPYRPHAPFARNKRYLIYGFISLAVLFVLHVSLHINGPCGHMGCITSYLQQHPAAADNEQLDSASSIDSSMRNKGSWGGSGGSRNIGGTQKSSAKQALFVDAEGNLLPTVLDMQRVMAYPHVDECRQCKICIPQYAIDIQVGNSSSGRAGGAGRAAHLRGGMLRAWLGVRHSRQLLLLQSNSSFDSGDRQRQRWHVQQQHWHQAAAASAQSRPDGAASDAGGTVGARSWLRQLLAKDIDGVKTHLEWLAKQQEGLTNPDTRALPGIQVIVRLPDSTFNWAGRTYHIGPASIEQDASKIRRCTVCRGCQQLLQPMPTGLNWLGSHFSHEVGASPGWMVRVDPEQLAGGSSSAGSSASAGSSRKNVAVAKVWCVPVPKPGTRIPAVCNTTRIREQLQVVLAIQEIATDCGLDHVLPRHWVAPVDGVLPVVGFRVSWDALWAGLVVGVSAENLVHGGRPHVESSLLLTYLQDKLNSTQVIAAATFDLLFSQCDRHAQNLYVLPDGSLSLIDNDQAYGSSWRSCGVDSIFLPGTQKHEVARLGYRYVMKKPEYAPPQQPRDYADPLQLLDYRCHAPGGAVGKQYPTTVARCLKKLSSMSPKAIVMKFSYPNEDMAAALQQRAKDMLQQGFEWTLKYGWPQNPGPNRYKWAKACCQMRFMANDTATSPQLLTSSKHANAERKYECTAWKDESAGWHTDLPIGDAALGTDWQYTGKDTGTYNLTEEWAGMAYNGHAA